MFQLMLVSARSSRNPRQPLSRPLHKKKWKKSKEQPLRSLF
jgi:hypothetical protein